MKKRERGKDERMKSVKERDYEKEREKISMVRKAPIVSLHIGLIM